MTLVSLLLAATLAFAQTSPSDSATSPETVGTIESVPEGSDPATPATIMNTANPATPQSYVESPRDNGFLPNLLWLIPLVIAVAALFPFARRWSNRRATDVTVQPRV